MAGDRGTRKGHNFIRTHKNVLSVRDLCVPNDYAEERETVMVGTVQDIESRVRHCGHLRPPRALWRRLPCELQDAGSLPSRITSCQENLRGDKIAPLEIHKGSGSMHHHR